PLPGDRPAPPGGDLMATRWYLPSAGAAATAPDPDTEWDDTSTFDRVTMLRTPSGTAMAESSITKPIGMNALDQDFLWRQYISEPLAAQTIDGAVKGRVITRQGTSTTNARMQVIIRVVSEDGTM